MHTFRALFFLTAIFSCSALSGAEFHPPAGENYALVAANGSVLPGGRLLRPYGVQIETGPAPFGLAVSPKGTIATADIGYERFGITVIDPPAGKSSWQVRHIWARTPNSTAPEVADPDWRSVGLGIAFESEKAFWVSEAGSGRIRLIDVASGDTRKLVDLNSSFCGDLAWDHARHLLYAADQSNNRVVIIEGRSGRIQATMAAGDVPFAIALSADGNQAWVTVSKEVLVFDVGNPLKPELLERIPVPSPQALLATADRVYVSNARDDSITVISAADRKVVTTIPLGIPSLEQFRGIVPAGLAYDPVTKWLLVAESGINALGVVDTAKNELIGHLPVGWMPTRVAIAGDRVYVANAFGRGSGPNPKRAILELGERPVVHHGSVSTFLLPDESELLRQSGTVFSFNGMVPYMRDTPKAPAPIRHVVLIVKENRSFDEVLGDIDKAGNGSVVSFATMARYGMHGKAAGTRRQFSYQDVPITPNQHEIAGRWAFSDNFYAQGNTRADGELWLNGGIPDLISESGILSARNGRPEGEFWNHLRNNGINFQNFDDARGTDIPDLTRAEDFIAELNRSYSEGGEALPGFICVHLHNDRPGDVRPQSGYPYAASFIGDNDLATGRILDYLSHSPWWRDMAVFVTETDTQGSFDHVDAHRTLLLAAGPYIKRNYVSRTNSSFSGLLRTIFELLGTPPLHLADATAASLREMFTAEPDFTPFSAIPSDPRIFDPAKLTVPEP